MFRIGHKVYVERHGRVFHRGGTLRGSEKPRERDEAWEATDKNARRRVMNQEFAEALAEAHSYPEPHVEPTVEPIKVGRGSARRRVQFIRHQNELVALCA